MKRTTMRKMSGAQQFKRTLIKSALPSGSARTELTDQIEAKQLPDK
jgi:hypothetical protein